MSIKTKNQSLLSFFESLQKEYIIAELRAKIYPSKKDRAYYRNRVMKGKREKIEAIANRNKIESIFTSASVYDKHYSEIIPLWGMPYFKYNDEKNRQWQLPQDSLNYFSVNSDVAIRNEGGSLLTGKISSNDYLLANNTVEVIQTGKTKSTTISIKDLKRVL